MIGKGEYRRYSPKEIKEYIDCGMMIKKKRLMLAKDYFKKDELTRGGGIILIGSLIGGIFSYIYQAYMGRMLGPEEYGIFGALFAIFYMISIISQTLSTSVTRFVSKFIGEGKQIGFFIKGSIKQMAIIGFVISIIFLISNRWLMSILKLSSPWPVFVLIFILFLVWIFPIIEGGIRGVKRFSVLGLASVSNAFSKLIFGMSLVMLGYGVSGALMGVAFGILSALLISFIFLKPYIRSNNPHEPDFKFSSFYFYSIPVMFAMMCLSVPSNADVVIAKYFLSPIDTGIYTSVSVFGKIIYFFPNAIGTVMFPMVVEKHVQKENTKSILKKSLIYTGILSGSLTIVYILFPQLIVKMFGQDYVSAIALVVPYGMTMFFFSITTVLLKYHLAIKDMKYIILFVGFTISEILLLFVFHSSISEMIYILFSVNLIFSIVSLFYTWRWYYDINCDTNI